MTIWRDLTALEENGLLRKVRGGAVRVDLRGGKEPLYRANRSSTSISKKRSPCSPSSILSATATSSSSRLGTTVAAMAKHLRRYRQLTVIGDGSRTMNELAPLGPRLTVYCCGGMLAQSLHTFVPAGGGVLSPHQRQHLFPECHRREFPGGHHRREPLEIQVSGPWRATPGRWSFSWTPRSSAPVVHGSWISTTFRYWSPTTGRPPHGRALPGRATRRFGAGSRVRDDLRGLPLGSCGSCRSSEKDRGRSRRCSAPIKRGPPLPQCTPLLPVRDTAQPQCSRGCPGCVRKFPPDPGCLRSSAPRSGAGLRGVAPPSAAACCAGSAPRAPGAGWAGVGGGEFLRPEAGRTGTSSSISTELSATSARMALTLSGRTSATPPLTAMYSLPAFCPARIRRCPSW